MKITQAAIAHKSTVFVGLIVLTIAGLFSYQQMPKESAPDIAIPIVVVTTVYPGVAPEDMEKLVTVPIEKELKELSGVDEIISTSSEGVSSITVEFLPEVNMDFALQKVREKVDLAKPEIPEDAEEPILTEVNVSEFPILVLTFTGGTSISQLEGIAEDLQDRVEMISGVLDATVTGGLEREIQVIPDPDRLKAYNVSLMQLVNVLSRENINIPGGTMDIQSLKYTVRVPGEFTDINEIPEIVIKAEEGKPVFLKDVAVVKDSFKDRKTYSRFNGMDCITLTVRKRAGENSVRIVDEVKKLVEIQQEILPDSITINQSFDQSKEIKMMISELENSIISGVILIIAVILFFMGKRNSFFVALAIPFSMLMTFLILHFLGYTLNMVVLFSLILAVGMLVDNAVVIVENIYRHREEGYNKVDSAVLGTQEVGWPVITSTATTVAAFFPMIFWPDVIGKFMGYLPKTVCVVLLSSLFVAMAINPVFCSVFMEVKKKKKKQGHGMDMVYNIYNRLLDFCLRKRLLTMISCAFLLVGIIIVYGKFGYGVEFFPASDPKRANIDVSFQEGGNLENSNNAVKQIEEILYQIEDVKNVITTVGAQSDSESGLGFASTHLSRIMVEFFDYEKRVRPSVEVLEEIREKINKINIPGATILIEKEQNGPPQDMPVDIEISGDNFNKLGEIAEDIKRRIKDVEGLVDLDTDYDAGRPEYKIIIDREKATLSKFSTYDIAMTVRTAFNGLEAGEYRDGDDEYDITVRLPEDRRKDFNDIRSLNMVDKDGFNVPLSNLTKVVQSSGFGAISRKDNKRTVSVTANNQDGYNANILLQEIKKILKNYPVPRGYHIKFAGQQEEQDKQAAFLFQAFVIAVFLITIILVTEFNSITMPLIIMVSVVLSLFGVFSGLLVLKMPFGIIMTGIGVISLAGIVVNNAIVLIDYILQLKAKGFSTMDAVRKAGETRLRPVLLTAITTIVGLIPLATGYGYDFREMVFVFGSESSEWWGPMAVAVIFGLTFATILTLVVVPVMFTIVSDLQDRLNNFFHSEDSSENKDDQLEFNVKTTRV